MPVDAEAVAVTLRAAGIDAVTSNGDGGPVVTLNPGDASTFLDLLTRGGRQSEHHQIIRELADTCPHGNAGADDECRYCGGTGESDDWPGAEDEHSDSCLWVVANRWTRRHRP